MARSRSTWVEALALVATLLGMMGTLVSWALHRQVAELDARVASARLAIQRAHTSPSPSFDPTRIVESVKDSVVTVSAGGNLGSGFAFGRNDGRTMIVTNYHVIARPGGRFHAAVAIGQGGDRWRGEVVTFDPEEDLAIVAVPVEIPILASAYSMGHEPRVGDSVLVYGSPAGFEGTATVGIVSAVRGDWIQTDAQINPGSSGAPLINMHGEVVGITSLGYAGGGSGLGFAIDIRRVCVLEPALACDRDSS